MVTWTSDADNQDHEAEYRSWLYSLSDSELLSYLSENSIDKILDCEVDLINGILERIYWEALANLAEMV